MNISLEAIQKASSVHVKSAPTRSRAPSFKINGSLRLSSKIDDKVREEFYREMHLMFDTGIDLRMALEIVSSDMKSKSQVEIFARIRKQIVDGLSLSEALEKAGHFSKYEYQNVRIGEESGTLNEVLKQLADHFKNKRAQCKQLTSALSYPVLVLLTSLGAVAFMLNVVVPMFEDVFKRFGNDLPWITQLVIDTSRWFGAHMYLIVGFTFALVLSALYFRDRLWLRKQASAIALKVPFFGEVLRASQLAKFSSAMYLLITARHPLVQSLGLVKEMVGFYPIEVSLSQASVDLMAGESLSGSLSRHSIYPKKMIALLKMAEEVNHLAQVFQQLRDQYTEEVKYKSGLLSSVLEPILIIFIGLVVGVILVAMYLPLFSLSTNIG